MKDRYKEHLQHDTRLLTRNLRNHIISEGQIKELQTTFPDSAANARWLHQDGTVCDAEKEAEMQQLHKDGWQELLTGPKS